MTCAMGKNMARRAKNTPENLATEPLKAVMRLDVSMPEARKAARAFARDRKAALEAFSIAIRDGVASAVSQMLDAEMTVFIGCREPSGNRRNGSKTREYSLKGVGTLTVSMPRDRAGKFESHVLPSRERTDPRLRKDLAALHLAGISSRSIANIGKPIPQQGHTPSGIGRNGEISNTLKVEPFYGDVWRSIK